MNRLGPALAALAIAAALGAGYWWGSRSQPVTTSRPVAETVQPERRIAYYRNPMGLPDTSPTPKKDSMGMDYVPVYEGEEPPGKQLQLSTEKIQKLGVTDRVGGPARPVRPLRAVGTVAVDERRLHTLTARFEGYVQRLFVNATGQTVVRGQPVADVYSRGAGGGTARVSGGARGCSLRSRTPTKTPAPACSELAAASLARLRHWQISAGSARPIEA